MASVSSEIPSPDNEPLSGKNALEPLQFYGGALGALAPFIFFVTGVIIIALFGAPDERGFWPILIFALSIGLLLARDRQRFCQTVVTGMSQEIVMIMIAAWMLASIIGSLMTVTGLVEALTWLASQLNLGGVAFVLAAFVICCIVSLSTGSSFATILICAPLLYPVGGALGAHLPTLAGAILGGATFGDCIAPISDTTIASALSQQAAIGASVRSRLKYVIPAGLIAVLLYFLSASVSENGAVTDAQNIAGNPDGLPMILVPGLIIFLFLRGKHLIHGLLFGLLFGAALGLSLSLLPLEKLLSLDLQNFTARSFIIDGMNRAVGIGFFTILLMGLVATLQQSGLFDRLVNFAAQYSKTAKQAEFWISGTVGAAVLLTTHSIVAILTVGEFVRKTGKKAGVEKLRRANLLSLIVCVFPFLLPYFIPVILMANATTAGVESGTPSVSPLAVGLHNFVAWGLLMMTAIALFFGFGRKSEKKEKARV